MELLRINRNIVECKERQKARDRINEIGINRNIVECKGLFINFAQGIRYWY